MHRDCEAFLEDEWLFGASWGDSRAVLGLGGWHLTYDVASALLCCHKPLLLHCIVGFVPCLSSYNLQWWMSWLEHWWRAQRSVISIVNCRIPWINRILNVFCAFGKFLRACLLQSLLLLLPGAFGSSASCVSVRPCVSRNTSLCPWHTQCACYDGLWCTSYVLNTCVLVVVAAPRHQASGLCFARWRFTPIFQDMKSDQQTHWI